MPDRAQPRGFPPGVAILLGLPPLGLAAFLAWPALDGRWQHDPAHVWIVLAAAALTSGLAYATGSAAARRSDLRVALLALAFLACGLLLGLHALLTPRTLVDDGTVGFAVATPAGLVLAAVLAAASSLVPDSGAPPMALRAVAPLRAAIMLGTTAWAITTVAGIGPLAARTAPERASTPAVTLAVVGLGCFAVAITRYALVLRRRPTPLVLATVVALVLLAEALLGAALSPAWHLTWWGWHVLILVAVAVLAITVHREWHEERFGDLYLGATSAGARDLTVLFADLQGFTALAERSDPVEVSRILNRYLDAAIPAIVANGGAVDRIMGDGIMATFNRAGDRPTHAGDAVRAAVALQEATGAVAAAEPGWPRFRVGVNTGPAVVCVLGAAGGRTHTVIGDTVNVAARLEALAPPGGIALGAETARRSGASVTSAGSVPVKGRAAAVDALLLTGIGTVPGGPG